MRSPLSALECVHCYSSSQPRLTFAGVPNVYIPAPRPVSVSNECSSSPPDVTEKVTSKALEVGYRHVSCVATPNKPTDGRLTDNRSIAPRPTGTKRKVPKPSPKPGSTARRSSTRAKCLSRRRATRPPKRPSRRVWRRQRSWVTLTCTSPFSLISLLEDS